MSQLGHSRPSHFAPAMNNVCCASDSDHSRYESELTLWAKSCREQVQQNPLSKASLFDPAVAINKPVAIDVTRAFLCGTTADRRLLTFIMRMSREGAQRPTAHEGRLGLQGLLNSNRVGLIFPSS
jgi:hypothetical protein